MALTPPGSALHLLDQAIDMAEYEEVFRKPASTNASRLAKVVWLLDGFLAEIATDTNLGPAEFFAMADLLPGNARGVHDGLYRAVDIYLKVRFLPRSPNRTHRHEIDLGIHTFPLILAYILSIDLGMYIPFH